MLLLLLFGLSEIALLVSRNIIANGQKATLRDQLMVEYFKHSVHTDLGPMSS